MSEILFVDPLKADFFIFLFFYLVKTEKMYTLIGEVENCTKCQTLHLKI